MKPDHLFHDDAEYEDDDNAEWIRMMGINIYLVYFNYFAFHLVHYLLQYYVYNLSPY